MNWHCGKIDLTLLCTAASWCHLMTGLQCSVACRRCVCEGSASRQKFTRCCWLEEALLLLFICTKKSKTTVFFWTSSSRCPSKTCSVDCNSITIINSAHKHLNQLFFSIFWNHSSSSTFIWLVIMIWLLLCCSLYSIDGKSSSVQYLYNVELENTTTMPCSILSILVALLIEVLFHFYDSRSMYLKTFSSASFVKNISLIPGWRMWWGTSLKKELFL